MTLIILKLQMKVQLLIFTVVYESYSDYDVVLYIMTMKTFS